MSTQALAASGVEGPAEPGMGTAGLLLLGMGLGAVALLDLMPGVLLIVALAVAGRVSRHPEETAAGGVLFLFASGVLLPYAARFEGRVQPWEMYYWSAGLLIVTLAGSWRLGLGRVWRAIPWAGRMFVWVALLAALRGVSNGASSSYVVRQLYGALLLPVYMGLGAAAGDDELLVARVARWGSLTGLCFLVYYAAVFPRYGFHKEMGFVGTQAAMLALVLLVEAIRRRRGAWLAGGVALGMVPVLIFMRKDVLMVLFGLILAGGMSLRRRTGRMAVYLLCFLIMLPSLWPPTTQWVNDQLAERAPGLYALFPDGSKDSSSLLDRATELLAAVDAVRAHPLLADGLGVEIDWESSFTSLAYAHYVDSGWGYLLQKFGLLGTASFLLLAGVALGAASRRSLGVSACLLASALITFFSEPVFFHFTTSPILGAMAGVLIARRRAGLEHARAVERQEVGGDDADDRRA